MLAKIPGLPFTARLSPCYESVRTHTPGLYQQFAEKVTATADQPDAIIATLGELQEVWEDFLKTDTDRVSRVVVDDWRCILGDWTASRLDPVVEQVKANGEDPKGQLTNFQAALEEKVSNAPNWLMIKMNLMGAINGL